MCCPESEESCQTLEWILGSMGNEKCSCSEVWSSCEQFHSHKPRSRGHRAGVNLLFLTFLRSRGGSLRALMMREDADGTTETVACRFWIVNLTVIFRPFHSCVALAMSSPTFFGDYRKKTETSSQNQTRHSNSLDIFTSYTFHISTELKHFKT